MLVVISIIVILIALTAAATLRFLGVQSTNNTRMLVQRLDSQLRKQWSSVADTARTEPIPDSVVSMAQGDTDRARVIWVKLRLKQAFPTSFQEILNPNFPVGIGPLPSYQQYLQGLGYTAANTAVTQPHESAACLLMALQRGPGGGGVAAEDLGGSSMIRLAPYVANSGAQPIAAIFDSWGTPIVFTRWPTGDPSTGISDVNPDGYKPGANDPGDGFGRLTNDSAWITSANGLLFQNYCHALPPTGLQSTNLSPTIVSAGQDKKMDVNFTTLATSGAGAKDNIYSVYQP
jgi:hypothetical protein